MFQSLSNLTLKLDLECRRCLQEASIQAAPKSWLEKLLQFICRPGQSLTDINRRSAGIPFAFSALIGARPNRGSRILLAFGMERLTAVAQASHAQPYPQTHAFWCLTALFQDKDLGADLHPFVVTGPPKLPTTANPWIAFGLSFADRSRLILY